MDMMKDALAKRRGKGFEIKIAIEPMDESKTDLAPEVKDEAEMPMEAPEVEVESEDEGYPMDGVSEYEKSSLMERKPKSLGDRVRMEALKKGK